MDENGREMGQVPDFSLIPASPSKKSYEWKNISFNPEKDDNDETESFTTSTTDHYFDGSTVNGHLDIPKPGILSKRKFGSSKRINIKEKFTVERIDAETHRWNESSPILFSIMKTFFALILACLTLFCVVSSKFTMVLIADKLHKHEGNKTVKCDDNIPGSCEREVAIVMLSVILMIPPAFTFLKQFVLTCRKISHPWPTSQAILFGVIGTLMESAGLCLFFIGLVHLIKDFDLIFLLMNAIFICPIIGQIWNKIEDLVTADDLDISRQLMNKRKRRQKQDIIQSVAALLLQLSGICGTLYIIWGQEKPGESTAVTIASICLIGISWSPKIRDLQIDHDLAYDRNDNNSEVLEQSQIPSRHRQRYFREDNSENKFSRSNSFNKNRHQTIYDDVSKIVVQTNTSRGKASLINSLLKLIFIPSFIALFAHIFDCADLSKIGSGFSYISENRTLLVLFILQIITSFVGYHLAWIGCTITMQRTCFALPLTLSTPICLLIVLTKQCNQFGMEKCPTYVYNDKLSVYIIVSVLLYLGQFIATTFYAWGSQDFVMADEATLFWVPTYDGSLLEQNILLNRKNEATNEFFVSYRSLVKDTTIYICTTMYHEADYEMEQLLFSIAGVDRARKKDRRKIEAHIWFDDGVREKTLKSYAIQLVSLLPDTVGVGAENAIKLDTPYGIELKWILPGGMPLHIHLKDNFKVKNKKRWSQVMYMSYVLDYREKGNLDHCFILTTDADVKFFPEDVSALMDFMSSDPSVGAVCARTFPMGNGPMVWYQIFDYAIGHWLLKVAEHVLGSVLCSPGCFSLYRCRAIEDVLPKYASSVQCALDFLTKDMGEDRWLCTLLIEHGWRLDYCASSSNVTYCPESFEEFYKQRRRWGPSTLANQAVLIQSQMKIRHSNDDINLFFILYQVLMMISTLIGPGTVLLVMSSGLHTVYQEQVDLNVMFFINLIVVLGYVYICLYYKQNTQIKTALILTFIYSIVMTIVFVGLLILIIDDCRDQMNNGWKYYSVNSTGKFSIDINDLPSGLDTPGIIREFSFRFTPPSIYLMLLLGVFFVSAILHGVDGLSLVHGIWYLLCLPSGYLFLMIYSLANITDRSWGTREVKQKKTKKIGDDLPWNHYLYFKFKEIFFCCFKDRNEVLGYERLPTDSKEEKGKLSKQISMNLSAKKKKLSRAVKTISEENEVFREKREGDVIIDQQAQEKPMFRRDSDQPAMRRQERLSTRTSVDEFSSMSSISEQGGSLQYSESVFQVRDVFTIMRTEDWLTGPYITYIKNFKDAGYDDTSFLYGLKEQDLIDIGITNRGHRKQILSKIVRLPPAEIEQDVPEDVYIWLVTIGLEEYWSVFEDNSYGEPDALADLKFMDKATLKSTFQVKKPGHLRKLVQAINQLQYSTPEKRKLRDTKINIEKISTTRLEDQSLEEFHFWDKLRRICLLTQQAAFSQSEELHSKLFELRNMALIVFAVANILWITVMLAILNQGKKLQVFKTSFLSVAFLFLNALVMILQFVTLLVHRLSTWLHFIGKTPFIPGSKERKSWSFRDDDLPVGPTRDDIEEAQKEISLRLRRRSEQRNRVAKQRGTFLSKGIPLFKMKSIIKR